MNRRVPYAFPLSLCLPVVAAVALAACGGSSPTDAVTGAPAATSAARVGTLSKSDDKVPVCHNGEDKLIPPDALADHRGHGDAEGACCPCFSAEEIIDTWGDCDDLVLVQCPSGDPTTTAMALSCDGAGGPGVSLSYQSTIGSCGGPSATSTEGDAAQHSACVAAIEATEYCSAP
jgi:hypothetical protein